MQHSTRYPKTHVGGPDLDLFVPIVSSKSLLCPVVLNLESILILPFGFTFLAARPKKSLGSTSFKTSLSLTSDFLGGLEGPGFVAKSSSKKY